MKWFVRAAWALLVIVLLIGAAAAVLVRRSLPTLDGALQLPGLGAPVSVRHDASDVTHIHARTERDAWRVMGWVHAQERGWQLEFNRRVMHGELSEILGEATLETDKLMRSLGVLRAAQVQYDRLPEESRQALQAYSEGINAYHVNGSQQPEFLILGVKPGQWTPVDSVGWAIMMALDLGGNWGNEFARLTAARVLDTAQLWQLMPPYPGEKPAASADISRLYRELGVYRSLTAEKNSKSIAENDHLTLARSSFDVRLSFAALAGGNAELARWAADFSRDAGTLEGKGSNNWVVAGSHTVSGKPLLANDPHLGLSAPAVWYFASLTTDEGRGTDGKPTPGLGVMGATFPGLPFVVLGRTREVAWGVTNTGPDVQDLYIEQINPDNPKQYRTPDGWADFQSRQETIKVKGKPDVTVALRSTRHGPVLSDAQASHAALLDLAKYVIALRWTALDPDNQTVVAGILANRARSVDELLVAYSHWHSPMQNAVMADVNGRIAFRAIGKVPLRRDDNDIRGVAPSPGWDARYDWSGWIPYAETPQDDPTTTAARGWIATANQRITSDRYPYFMGQDWHEPYRFDRIEQLLAATPKHDAASMTRIQADQLSLATVKLLPWLQKAAPAHPLTAAAQAQLKGFDGVMRADSAAPLIFAVWADELTRGLLIPRLGEVNFKALYGKRQFRTAVEGILARDDAGWCAPKTCSVQTADALARALDRIQAELGGDVAKWQWGRMHPAISTHRPFGSVAVLANYFDVQVPTGGDSYTVNVGQYWPNSPEMPFASRHAASLRTIYDLSDLEKSQFIYQTGQSGLVFSDRYRDMKDAWAAVQYRPLRLKPDGFVHSLQLEP